MTQDTANTSTAADRPMMDPRQQRGLEIAAKFKIFRRGDSWMVPSQTGNKVRYKVVPDAESPHCNCPDHELAGHKCKHIYAVEYVIQRELNFDGSETVTETVTVQQTVKKTYRQDWPAYNAAQVNEKSTFQVLLKELCSGIVETPRVGRGRRRILLRDGIFAAAFKVYSTVSARRFMSDLHDAHEKGFIGRLPCYNSLFHVLEKESVFEVLRALIVESAVPLSSLESHFSCDSSGFSGCRFDRWYDHKFGQHRMVRAWVKAHVMTGRLTNTITAVEIHSPMAGDSPQLRPLMKTTAQNFGIKELSADMAYSTKANLEAISAAGAMPLIPFKRTATPATGGVWGRMFHYVQLHREEFEQRYHLRSNVESTFSMLKAKFGDSVRSKTDVAMKNEVLCKILCHNICCLIQSMYEFGISPNLGTRKPDLAG